MHKMCSKTGGYLNCITYFDVCVLNVYSICNMYINLPVSGQKSETISAMVKKAKTK